MRCFCIISWLLLYWSLEVDAVTWLTNSYIIYINAGSSFIIVRFRFIVHLWIYMRLICIILPFKIRCNRFSDFFHVNIGLPAWRLSPTSYSFSKTHRVLQLLQSLIEIVHLKIICSRQLVYFDVFCYRWNCFVINVFLRLTWFSRRNLIFWGALNVI